MPYNCIFNANNLLLNPRVKTRETAMVIFCSVTPHQQAATRGSLLKHDNAFSPGAARATA